MADRKSKDELEQERVEEPIAETGEREAEADVYLRTIEDLRKERDEYYDLLLRKQAEFDNYRKRVNREKDETRLTVTIDILQELLPVIDSCEKGLAALEASAGEQGTFETYRDGYALLLKQLRAFLDRFRVEEVPGTGSPFDPNLHEAVLREVTADHQEGEILEEYRKGYLIGDRLLRPSQVKVAVQPENTNLEA